jgi:dolichol-phosphate mannosyltransferase
MLSAVIPLRDEQGSLEELHGELAAVAREHGYDLEIVLIDDGSTDDSWAVVERLAAQDPRVRGIRFRRNFGKAAALSAGFDAARGDLVITLDADLQDDPREIPRFLAEIDKGLDCISGWKQVRHDPWHKVGPSRVFNWLVGALTGVKLHDHNCGFKCYRREIFDEVRLYGELHRFVPVLAAARGWKVGEIVVNHRPRQHGRSKYGVSRIIKGFLDLFTVYFLTGFEQRPQHLLGTCGIFAFAIGLAGLLYLTAMWLLKNATPWETWYPEWKIQPLHERPALLYSMGMLLLGAQFISMGFLAELFTAYYGRNVRPYSIKSRVNLPEAEVAGTGTPAKRVDVPSDGNGTRSVPTTYQQS